MMGGSMFGVGFGLFWMLFNIVLIVGVIALGAWAVQRFAGSGGGQESGGRSQDQTASAREILDERYARGELDREEYWEKLRDISG